MVKKTSARLAANGASTSLGYVVNDEELLDEILGEYDHKKRTKKNAAAKGAAVKAQK